MRNITIFLIAIILSSCYDSFKTPNTDSRAPEANFSLSQLNEMYAGETFIVENDIIVDGYVTSNDKSDNFYRSFTIEKNGTGIEIMAGIYDLWHIYPVGYKVTLNLNELAVTRSYGMIQVGRKAKAYDGYEVDYIGSKVVLDNHVYHSYDYIEIQPSITTITSVGEMMCGQLMQIEDLTYSPESEIESTTWSGYKRFVDKDGDYIWTYTRTYADFAENNIPFTTISLTGIIQQRSAMSTSADQSYAIKLRNEEDCD